MAFEIMVRLLGDGSGFGRMLNEAGAKANTFGAGLKARLAGAFSVGALTMAARATMSYASNLTDLAKRLEVGTDKLQAWDFAAKQNGTSLDTVTSSLQALAKARAAALEDPTGDKMGLFKALGIDAAALKNSPIEALFERIAETIRTTDFGANELAIVQELLGRSGAELLPAIKAGLAAAADQAQRLGIIIDKDTLAALDEADDAIGRMKMTFQSIVAGPVAWLLRRLQEIVDLMRLVIEPGVALAGGLMSGDPSAAAELAGKTYSQILNEIAHRDVKKVEAPRTKGADLSAFLGEKARNLDAAKAAREEAAIKEKLFGFELKLLDVTARRAKLEKAIRDAMDQVDLAGEFLSRDEQLEAVKQMLDLAGQLEGVKSAAVKPEKFTAVSDSLSKIGGFIGGASNPQTDFTRTQIESNRKLDELTKTQRELLNEVRKLGRAILDQT